jgi:bifunctional non-homologous end joining protein LigD
LPGSAKASDATESTVHIDRRIVEITHAEKVLFSNDGITKREFVEYYQRIAATMLPHLRERPIVMERYPDGIHGQKTFQKNAPDYYPAWIKTVSLPKKDGVVRHVVCNDAATLVEHADRSWNIERHDWSLQTGRSLKEIAAGSHGAC